MIAMRRLGLVALMSMLGLALPAIGSAQGIIINPTGVEFVASTDHDRQVTIEGTVFDVVTGYELRIYVSGASAPISTVDLGKSAPDPSGRILARPTELVGLPLGAYIVTVAAVGPGGTAESTPTPPFARIPAPAAPTQVAVTTGSP